MNGRANRITNDETQARLSRQFSSYDRSAFIDHLATACGVLPTQEELRKFARKFPNRFAEYVATFARLAGFTDRRESVNVSILMDVSAMSDAEVFAQLEDINRRLLLVAPSTDDQRTDEAAAAGPSPAAPAKVK